MSTFLKSNYFHYSLIVPDQVLNLTVQPSELSNGLISLTVTWDEPHSDVTITRYESNYRIQSTGSWRGGLAQPAANRQCVLRDLMSGVNYEVRMRAVSAIGTGEYRTAITSCMQVTYMFHVINVHFNF